MKDRKMMRMINIVGVALILVLLSTSITVISGFHFSSKIGLPTAISRQCHDDDNIDNNIILRDRENDKIITADVSRRDWFKRSITIAVGTGAFLLATTTTTNQVVNAEDNTRAGIIMDSNNNNNNSTSSSEQATTTTAELAPINLTKVATENKVNVKLMCPPKDNAIVGCITVDPKTFTKIAEPKQVPWWLPSFLVPKPQVVKSIPNTEILQAAIVAGSIIEMTRTTLLYPLSTIKTRVQATEGKQRVIRRNLKINNRRKILKLRTIQRRIQVIGLSIQRQVRKGNLYAGLLPSLLVAVPCAGVYYGIRDITKRMLLTMLITITLDGTTITKSDEVVIAVVGALVADVVTLVVRTPGDLLAARLQVGPSIIQKSKDDDEKTSSFEDITGDWINDSIKRLPASILTDLPYLLTRIALNGYIAQGDEDIGRYELLYICTACLCALLTTPFDVARTRILVDSNDDVEDGIDGGSGDGLLRTMRTVMGESDGGTRNLFRGWFERVVYLGIGRAWLEPINIIGYNGIRDAVLLKWFD